MNITHEAGANGVTVLRLQGDLDASTFETLIERGRELYASGARALLIDMAEVGYMGSSGLVALHSVALILCGQEPPDPEMGWGAFHALQDDVEGDGVSRVKILRPQPSVVRTLERTGLATFIEIHDDEQAALDSF